MTDAPPLPQKPGDPDETEGRALYRAAAETRARADVALGSRRVSMTDAPPVPRRIQLRRTKGWRMPPNTVIVARPTMWGNRWKPGVWSNTLGRNVESVQEAVDLYRLLAWPDAHHLAWVRENLAGKNLACWCPLDQPCHADVLLEIANAD